jgi:hypothetical protein
MFRRFMNKSAGLAAALLFSCGLLFGAAQAQEFDNEAYSGLYEEGNHEERWYYDAYDAPRDDDYYAGNEWFNEESRYDGAYDDEWGDDDWFYDSYEEREAGDWGDWDLF